MVAVDTTASWNYSTAAFRQANGNTANQLDMVIGVSEDIITADVTGKVTSSTATGRFVAVGVGIDSTTVNSAQLMDSGTNVASTVVCGIWSNWKGYVGAGRHTLVWLEKGSGADTQTWQGNVAGYIQTGIIGSLLG